MWALVRSERLLRSRLDALEHRLSDASLAQMPEFEQRVGVLQELRYISNDRTVQLKASRFDSFSSCVAVAVCVCRVGWGVVVTWGMGAACMNQREKLHRNSPRISLLLSSPYPISNPRRAASRVRSTLATSWWPRSSSSAARCPT